MRKLLTTILTSMILAAVITTPAFAAGTNENGIVYNAPDQPSEPFSTPAFSKEYHPTDKSGWQTVALDKWKEVDGDYVTTPHSFAGGGVKACFTDLHHDYTVQLWENDPVSPDDKYKDEKTINSGSENKDCVTWSGIGGDSGKEELYVELNKSTDKKETIKIEWFD
ncbi:hypothetical protein GCM10009001_35780 [Virgibacillus siamensis]|uniref:Secreted protein n=1 Tax=Virgibacillus siamensis TaxID=480071 RepID=A0ABN1GNS1_9BACI